MNKRNLLFFVFSIIIGTILAQDNRQVKNVILMIPDGTSLASVSSARWYQWYNNPDKPSLNIDPYLCGTVLTYSSNAPIGDSAPTTSCYMTGVPSRAGWVATYPVADQLNDIIPMNPMKAYQPLMTVLEAAKLTQDKATGLVFTCEFPHATPADCSSHSYDRGKYEWIAPQMVHNDLNVVIGGGAGLLDEKSKNYLLGQGYGVFQNDIANFHNYSGNNMWCLFADRDMAYDLDRDPEKEPSLAEMTSKAIEKLSANENGFFLMVEGSKIDWAAHSNDPIAIITDMLAFDQACGVAFDFAKNNGETVVVVVPDHGNSGISIGSNHCKGYGKLTKDELFKNVSRYKITANGLIGRLHNTAAADIKSVFKEYTGIELTEEDLNNILLCEDYSKSELSNEERMKGTKLNGVVSKILNSNTCFGFTTTGHTGEEVFLAVYDPTPNRLMGHVTNIRLNQYLFESMGLKTPLTELTDTYFAKHPAVFEGMKYTIKQDNDQTPILEVKNKKNTLQLRPNTNIVLFNGKEIKLNSLVIYVDQNNTFYLPRSLRNYL
ncbi:MAG: alkaline phosphatase [Dysgonamonadaceae bacterium]|jgi:alkaline phosphatase|nr:alkaline phosphatase [Dysgonamonadaceae bacterium]